MHGRQTTADTSAMRLLCRADPELLLERDACDRLLALRHAADDNVQAFDHVFVAKVEDKGLPAARCVEDLAIVKCAVVVDRHTCTKPTACPRSGSGLHDLLGQARTQRVRRACLVGRSKLIVAGGIGNSGQLNTVELLDYDEPFSGWTYLTPMKTYRSRAVTGMALE